MTEMIKCPKCRSNPSSYSGCSECPATDDLLFPPLNHQKYVGLQGHGFCRVFAQMNIVTRVEGNEEFYYLIWRKDESRNGQDVFSATPIGIDKDSKGMVEFVLCDKDTELAAKEAEVTGLKADLQRVEEILRLEREERKSLQDAKDFVEQCKVALVNKANEAVLESTEEIKQKAKEREEQLLKEVDGWKTKVEETLKQKAKEAEEAAKKMEEMSQAHSAELKLCNEDAIKWKKQSQDLEQSMAEKDREFQLQKEQMTKEMAEKSESYEMKIASLTETLQIAVRMAAKNDSSGCSKTPAVSEAKTESTELMPHPKVGKTPSSASEDDETANESIGCDPETTVTPTLEVDSKPADFSTEMKQPHPVMINNSLASSEMETSGLIYTKSVSAPILANEERAGSSSSRKIPNMGYDGCVDSVNA